MNKLWEIIAELGIELHPDRISVIADKIRMLRSVDDFSSSKTSFGPNTDPKLVGMLHDAWKAVPETDPREIAAALKEASATSSLLEQRGAVDLVWTGPSTGIVPVRHTEQVLCEVIESATRRLFLVSFVAYEVDSISRVLHEAAARQVQITLLLESSSAQGGNVTVDSIRIMRNAAPSATIYTWSPSTGDSASIAKDGSVHAKCAVADGSTALITSANLSKAAMERNMELGVMIRGGNIPRTLEQHLDALIETKIVKLVDEND
jgi:phosphatidylserine/phosphatidylglycerophosphate/cardiolipin synthase-like enzyme